MIDETKIDRQQVFATRCSIDLGNLESIIKKIQPSNNDKTKKEIMSILNAEQRSHARFFLSDKNQGLTIQHLDPRQNKINSVRLQFLKNSGHFIKECLETWKCHQDGCDFELQEHIAYFVSFGEPPYSICRDRLRPDDEKLVIGARGSSKHLFQKHPDFVSKRLSKMGVKTK